MALPASVRAVIAATLKGTGPKSDVAPSPSAARRVLLVAGGACSECSIHNFDPSRVPHGQFSGIVVLIQGEPSEVEALTRKFASATYVADPGGLAHRALNADWTPRCYVLDAAGRLVWIQGWPDEGLPKQASQAKQPEVKK
jgi:hypothetical protein